MNEEQRQARIDALVKELSELRRQSGDGSNHEALLNECRMLKYQGKHIEAARHYRAKCCAEGGLK